jgi:hypothetical protein
MLVSLDIFWPLALLVDLQFHVVVAERNMVRRIVLYVFLIAIEFNALACHFQIDDLE